MTMTRRNKVTTSLRKSQDKLRWKDEKKTIASYST
jgi:hypothetical protein